LVLVPTTKKEKKDGSFFVYPIIAANMALIVEVREENNNDNLRPSSHVVTDNKDHLDNLL